MNNISKKTTLIILGITAIVCSRASFFFVNDPEGPNLLIVIGAAVILYVVSLIAFVFKFSNRLKLLLAILIQVIIVAVLYVCLN